MFTTGKIIFALSFIVVFVIALIWSYRKDSGTSNLHFKKSYKILIGLILFVILQFLIVKMRKFL